MGKHKNNTNEHKNNIKRKFLKIQGNRCAICGRVIAIVISNDQIRFLDAHLDHCHISNKCRGALCTNCNSGLGLFLDNPTIMREAARYVERKPLLDYSYYPSGDQRSRAE